MKVGVSQSGNLANSEWCLLRRRKEHDITSTSCKHAECGICRADYHVDIILLERLIKALKSNIAVHPFVIVSLLAAVTLVVLTIAFYFLFTR